MSETGLRSAILEAQDAAAVNEMFQRNGWTDGLPIVPPTEDAVLRLKARELGVYEPGEAEEAEIAARAQASLDEMIGYYLPFLTDPAKTEAENRAAVALVPNR